MEYKDYYKELGVEKTATEADIKKAYRKLVRKYHPDVSKEADADQRTKALNEAYGVLGDGEKRAAYDELGRNQGAQGQPFRPPPGWGSDFESSGADDSDFFADLFAHVGGRRRAGGSFQMQGEDSHAAITIDLQDSYQGARRHIVMRVPEGVVTVPPNSQTGRKLRLRGRGIPSAQPGDLYLLLEVVLPPAHDARARELYATMAREMAFNPRQKTGA